MKVRLSITAMNPSASCAVSFEATNFLGALASFQQRCQRQSVFGWKTIEIAVHGQILLVTPRRTASDG
jgi:hypothetical protein